MDAISFWERVNALIKSGKTTQRALSKDCGFTERRIETLVSTGRLPDTIEAFRIAQALGVTVEYLVTGEQPAKPDTAGLVKQAETLLDGLKKL